MPVRKREFKNGVKWAVDVKLPNGKRYRKVIGTKKQAEKVQKKLEAEIVEGLMDVKELMGHQSFEMTLQYAHLSEEHVKRQVLKLLFANE